MAYKPVARGGTLKIQIQRKRTITRLRPSGFHRARARGDVSERRTGRNVQLDIKATAEVVERFVALSDRRRWAPGETLEYALAGLEKALAKMN